MSKRRPSQVRAREGSNTQPTTAELEALEGFAEFLSKHKRSPTKRELSRHLGMSESGAQKHLSKLTQKGLLVELREMVVVGRDLSEKGRMWLKAREKAS